MTRTRSGKTLIVLLLGCSLVSVALGVGAAMFLGKKAAAQTERSRHGKHAEELVEPETVHPLGEMVVNLADQDTLRYAKVSIAVGFEEKVGEEELRELEPVLRDSLIGVITGKTFKELHRSGGLQKLKEELTETMAERVEKHAVVSVYLEGFAMQ